LVRNDLQGENKRIVIKKPQYKDVVVQFDFQFRGAGEIRLVTGGGGHYIFGVHIRRNRFRVKTADDMASGLSHQRNKPACGGCWDEYFG
jgi:hypothetical protein